MINIRLQGQKKKPDGTVVPVDAKTALFKRGPIIPVVIHPNPAFVVKSWHSMRTCRYRASRQWMST